MINITWIGTADIYIFFEPAAMDNQVSRTGKDMLATFRTARGADGEPRASCYGLKWSFSIHFSHGDWYS